MKGSRAALVSFAGAAAAAAAAAGGTMFITLPVKLASTLLMALAFPPHSFRELMHSAAALFLSAAVAGGAVLLAALAFGGTLRGGVIYGAIPLRAALLGAAAAAFMPRSIRKILSRRVRNEQIVHIEYEFAAPNSNRCEKNKSSHESKSSGITILKKRQAHFLGRMSRHYRHGQCAVRTDFRAAGHCVGRETAFGVCAGGKCSDPDAYRRRRKSSFRVKAQKTAY